MGIGFTWWRRCRSTCLLCYIHEGLKRIVGRAAPGTLIPTHIGRDGYLPGLLQNDLVALNGIHIGKYKERMRLDMCSCLVVFVGNRGLQAHHHQLLGDGHVTS